MREIKFRGIRKEYNSLHHDSEFKYGNLLNECSIGEVGEGLESYEYAVVIPETVGQYTGLKDKNGVEIYEGDIVRILYTDWASKSESDERSLQQYLIDIATIGVIEFNEDRFCVKTESKKYSDFYYGSIFPGKHGYIEIIGNIHQI